MKAGIGICWYGYHDTIEMARQFLILLMTHGQQKSCGHHSDLHLNVCLVLLYSPFIDFLKNSSGQQTANFQKVVSARVSIIGEIIFHTLVLYLRGGAWQKMFA